MHHMDSMMNSMMQSMQMHHPQQSIMQSPMHQHQHHNHHLHQQHSAMIPFGGMPGFPMADPFGMSSLGSIFQGFVSFSNQILERS